MEASIKDDIEREEFTYNIKRTTSKTYLLPRPQLICGGNHSKGSWTCQLCVEASKQVVRIVTSSDTCRLLTIYNHYVLLSLLHVHVHEEFASSAKDETWHHTTMPTIEVTCPIPCSGYENVQHIARKGNMIKQLFISQQHNSNEQIEVTILRMWSILSSKVSNYPDVSLGIR